MMTPRFQSDVSESWVALKRICSRASTNLSSR
jgi:hypothetical protein